MDEVSRVSVADPLGRLIAADFVREFGTAEEVAWLLPILEKWAWPGTCPAWLVQDRDTRRLVFMW